MIMLKMAKNRISQIILIWVTILLTSASRAENKTKIQNLSCFNDFYEKIVCSWEAFDSGCKDFDLTYEDFLKKKGKCSELGNETIGDSVVPNKCMCNIAVSAFASDEIYDIEVKLHGETVNTIQIPIGSTLKPRTPSNIQLDIQKENIVVMQWETGYNSTFIDNNLSFNVQIICKNSRIVTLEGNTEEKEPKYHFNQKQLKRGESYILRVRAKPRKQFNGTWSEWSPEIEWKNDYSLTILDLLYIVTPITCIVVLCLIIVSYVCLKRFKKKWWDNIPSPAKSSIVKRNLIEPKRFIQDRKSAAKHSCGRFFSRPDNALKSKLTLNNAAEQYVVVCSDHKCIFEPKNEVIERCVEIQLKVQNENNADQENKPEHESEDHPVGEDLSIANMFFTILNDSSNVKGDTFRNLNAGSLLGLDLMDSFYKEEKQSSSSNIPGHWKLGYHSSDNSSFTMDEVRIPHFDQFLNSETDRMPYIPSVSFNDDNSYQSKGDSFTNSGYNSFAKAAYNASKINTTKTFCLDNCSKSKSNIYNCQLNPKDILYYNTKCLCSNVSEYRFQPNSGQNILPMHESKSGPTSICQGSAYQSFDQAIQENELELGCQMSGYKSFGQAVQQGDETFVSAVNGYQSFDQAIRKSETSGSTNCLVLDPEYKPNIFINEINRYQSTDHTIQENGPEFGCQTSGYKSFDQALQESDVTSMCELNGYQSFHEAVSESKTSGSTNCIVLESGYKPFENFICQSNDYSDNNDCMDENDQLGDSNCKDITNFKSSQKYKPPSSDSMELGYNDIVKATKEQYPSFSDKTSKLFKKALDTNPKDTAIKHDNIPLALTFDICEHIRNLENMHRQKVLFNNMETGIIPIKQTICQCHFKEVSLTQEQFTINKNLALHNCPSTFTLENMSFGIPLYELDDSDPSETTKHLLIQQGSLDKDGNSYMKIK